MGWLAGGRYTLKAQHLLLTGAFAACRGPDSAQSTRKPPLTSMPELALQWHPTKNGSTAPSDMTTGSNKAFWWQCTACPCGTAQWQAQIKARAQKGTGCPVCAGRVPCACSSLSAIRPEIAVQWSPTGNDGLRPTDVTVGSQRLVHWECNKHQQPCTWGCQGQRSHQKVQPLWLLTMRPSIKRQ